MHFELVKILQETAAIFVIYYDSIHGEKFLLIFVNSVKIDLRKKLKILQKGLICEKFFPGKFPCIKFFLLILFELLFNTINTENIARRKRRASRTNKHARKSCTH